MGSLCPPGGEKRFQLKEYATLEWWLHTEVALQDGADTNLTRGEPADYMTVRRELAIKRIKAQKIHRWTLNLLVYLIVNAVLVISWVVLAATGWSHYVVTGLPQDFFWPIFTIVIWGIWVAINGYVAYRGNASTEEQIQREMKKLP